MSKRLILVISTVLVAVVLMTTAYTGAQDATSISYGTMVTGTVPADGGQVVYNFAGSAGDLVSIRAWGSTPDMQLDVDLFTSTQQLLFTGGDNPLNPTSLGTDLVFRLPETGTYYIVVSGSTGSFFLTLEARAASSAVTLELDDPKQIDLPLQANETRTFIFNTNPDASSTILIDAEPFNLNAFIEIRDGTGQIVTLLQGNVDNACINMGQSDEIREVTIAGSPLAIGSVTVTLSNRGCELSDQPVVVVPPVVIPVPIEGVCAVTSAGFVNIRSGPSTLYSIIGFMSPNQPLQVVGISESGTWYVVQNNQLQGWVARSVVGVTGPCDGLPVFVTPPLPAASVTPGLPLATVTPFVVTATGGPTQTPIVVTATPGTPEMTPTVEETSEVTPTVEATETAEVTPAP